MPCIDLLFLVLMNCKVKEVLASDDGGGDGGTGMIVATNTKNIGLSLTNVKSTINGSTVLAAVPNSTPAAFNRNSVTLMRKSPVNVHRSKVG